MKHFNITVNGTAYDVHVEELAAGAAPTAVQPKPYLVRVKNNEKINLDKPVYRIGKEKNK